MLIIIASFDEEVWYQMVRYDDEFKKYAQCFTITFTQLFTKQIILDDRTEYRLLGKLHHLFRPALVTKSGQFWYQNDLIHREGDQPAIIWNDGSKEWYRKGEHHREGDQPAIIRSNGSKEWYQYGKRHREKGPAIIWYCGSQQWYKNGEKHRDNDQPAVIWADGSKHWYQNGLR